MNVCVVGHGMMGEWHSNALARSDDAVLHTLVGRREEPTSEFARTHGFVNWTTSLESALDDDAIDVVVLATPSESHAATALLALQHEKHVLVEIPLAMTFEDAQCVVDEASTRGLALGVVHPLRARVDLAELQKRVVSGSERVRHVAGRLFMYRVENVGATGYRRSWTDNLLWHHMAHLVDAGVWLCGAEATRVESLMSPVDGTTGIPMDVSMLIETELAQSILASGSYYGRERLFELLVVTDRDSYRLDVLASTLTRESKQTQKIESEEENCSRVTLDFVAAVSERRDPMVTGASVLPAMRALEAAQLAWDRVHGRQSLPGRPIT